MRTLVIPTIALAIATLGSSTTATAQSNPAPVSRWEFIAGSGAIIPTGAQRGAIKRAAVSTAQLSYLVKPFAAINATAGWARSRDVASAGDPKLDIFTYDVGMDLRAPLVRMGKSATLRPFAGYGVGARSYNYRSLDVDATHNAAGYASLGGELAVARIRLRIEGRNYVTGFKPLAGAGESDTRNDLVVLMGLRFVRR